MKVQMPQIDLKANMDKAYLGTVRFKICQNLRS